MGSRSGNESFEFAILDAPGLGRHGADISPFSEHLASLSGQAVACAFANLGGDTALVAPANATGQPADYPHLAAFLRGDAPSDQVEKTWAELGRAIAGQLEQRELVWVSTCGLAVHWLHLRVDARPKYYNWSPYRSEPMTGQLLESCQPQCAGDDEVWGQTFREGNLEAHMHEESGAWRVELFISNGLDMPEATPLLWKQAIADLQEPQSAPLARLLSRILRKAPFEAFFWECAPVSRSGNESFEFAILDAPGLGRHGADISPFSEHLASLSGQAVACAFANLGGDTALVAPANATGRPADYPHLAAFLRGDAPSDQVEKTWAELGRAISSELKQREVVWVSTAGSAVHWLHLRVDKLPKYYHWSPYRCAQR